MACKTRKANQEVDGNWGTKSRQSGQPAIFWAKRSNNIVEQNAVSSWREFKLKRSGISTQKKNIHG